MKPFRLVAALVLLALSIPVIAQQQRTGRGVRASARP